MTTARLSRATVAAFVLLVTALLGVAGATAPAARAAAGDDLTVTTNDVQVGSRPTIEVRSDEAGAGRLRIAVLSTFGQGKGLPKDKRAWQTRVAYDGKPVSVDGPVLRVGDYRIKVWFIAEGSGTVEDGTTPQASTTFRVLTADGGRDAPSTGKDGPDGKATGDEGADGGSGAVIWIVLALVILAAAVAAVLLRGRGQRAPASSTAPGGRRRADDRIPPPPPVDAGGAGGGAGPEPLVSDPDRNSEH